MGDTKTAEELRDGVDAQSGDSLDLTLGKGALIVQLNDELDGAELVIYDESGEEQRALAAGEAQGVFKLAPGELPNPVELWWRTEEWAWRIVGPCDPIALRDALADDKVDEADKLVGDPPTDGDAEDSEPTEDDGEGEGEFAELGCTPDGSDNSSTGDEA